MASNASANVVPIGAGGRFFIYLLLLLFCLYYLLPLYVMLVNSLKPLAEIQAGGM
ncbi:MAG: carbohydrate ABC transporter permease, partial [Sphingomonadaceae bacterium]